jgi:hypothetical protein
MFHFSVLVQAYLLTIRIRNTSIANSNGINGGGVLSVLCASDSVIVLDTIQVVNISISQTTNGAIAVHGSLHSFSIDGTLLRNISTGNNGGAVFVNISQFSDPGDSYIRNIDILFCSAAYGGGIYIAQSGIVLYNINFTNNIATQIGSDIYENKTAANTFYSSLQLCCSDSEGITFVLSDDTDKSSLMPGCIAPSC